ncbi:hypothetical protein [Methylobacterium durans]|uniref:DUF2946 domain-containing protein n=1 Tax=Methylobacterium durans TaxID=2202825 RepID=A0A2U8W3F2_9HYPH|nr:hypothetical protein [Methylobacterium durans]AWN40625.1 hypothetical protein DK389_08890 [Methylobacterium durans]
MRPAPTRITSAGARIAVGAHWRLARCLLALLAILALSVPALEGSAEAATHHALAEHVSLDLPDPGFDAHPDGGLVHHCAHCACHQAVTSAPAEPAPCAAAAEIRFPARAETGPARAAAPPRRPPRA